jgi:predicted AAA+ superfamily ATPase
MIPRLLQLPNLQSYFLFGPRNTGKSTLIKSFYHAKNSLMFDLLDPSLEDRLRRDPSELTRIVQATPDNIQYIIIDEVQKIPKILDVIHHLIESTNKFYILTGSSARKLKYGGANLLAGRAFVYYLYPFSFLEIAEKFNLSDALNWGMLPKIMKLTTFQDKKRFLDAYSHTYIKEEIWAEQFVKNLDPFRKFLEVAAQMNGKIINFHKIALDVGVDDKTIKKYYSILEDTLIGFFLEAFSHSVRKRLNAKPKFYFFDVGVTRSLARMLTAPVLPRTSAYGNAFEHFIILECMKISNYYNNDYKFSYLMTKDDVEIDLVVERPAKPLLLIEIKSSNNVLREDISSFIKLTNDFKAAEAICLSNDPFAKIIDNVKVLPWGAGIKEYFALGGSQ